MARTFKPLHPLRGWRRVATQTWRPPRDPSVYAHLDIPVRSALAHLERLREETGVRVTVTHLVARGVALAIRQYPQLNGIVARGRIMLRDTVDIFLQVAIEGGTELSGIKIARADEKSVVEIAREMDARVERLRARRDRQVVRPMMTLGVTFDHRFMDGWHGGAMAQLFRAYLEDPRRFDEPKAAPVAAVT